MATAKQKAEALTLYEIAVACGDGWQEAATALALVLQPVAKPSSSDLTRPLKIGKRAKHWGAFVVAWADGTTTRVSGVVYDRPEDREAAAFQAADRLRRLRLRHGWEGEPGAPVRWRRNILGLQIETPEWWAYTRTRQLPPVASITEEAAAPAAAMAEAA